MQELADLRRLADASLDKHRAAAASLESERAALAGYREALAHDRHAQSVFQEVAKAVQHDAHAQMSGVVSHCLRTVFPDAVYSFRVNFVPRRGKTDAELTLVKDGHEVRAVEADSGGVTEVAALGLRVAALKLATPRPRQLLVLDEPFKSVHGAENRERAAALLPVLAKDLGIQIVMSTGLEWLRPGKVMEVG